VAGSIAVNDGTLTQPTIAAVKNRRGEFFDQETPRTITEARAPQVLQRSRLPLQSNH